ncbi:MAG TPA: hypothetical protein VGG64_20300 [Pirellulales bacterium]
MPRRLSAARRARRSQGQLFLITCLILGAGAVASQSAHGQATRPKQESQTVAEGRLYNLTADPFVFQLHRADGVAWTDGYVVPPGKYFAIKAVRPGDRSEVQGITGNGRGYVIIRHREPILNGYMTLRLPAQNPATQQVQPMWFAVKDANGITRMVQEANVEQAKAVQEKLQHQTPMTPVELERSRHMLRANWVLTD